MKGREKQRKSTLGLHQHAGGVQQRQLRPGFRPLCIHVFVPYVHRIQVFVPYPMRSIQVFVTGAGVHCIYAVRSVKELDGFEFSIATFFFHKMQVETCGSLLDVSYTWTIGHID